MRQRVVDWASDPHHLQRVHGVLTLVWLAQLLVVTVACVVLSFGDDRALLVAVFLGVAYISWCSVYANFVGHWGSWQASRAECRVADLDGG
jgi:hypothetical protein